MTKIMKKIWFPLLMATLIWNACNPVEFPDGVLENPVFSVSLTPDTQYQWVAGLNDHYLFTGVKKDVDSILQLSGTFASLFCPSGECGNSIRFEFLNNTVANVEEPALLFGPNTEWPYRFVQNDSLLGTVAIQLVSKEGRLYRSDFISQQDSNFVGHFFVESSEPWEKNERGEQTWKMTINFNCLLQNLQTQEVRNVQGQGVIGVAYQ
jgi:hypothetical protein